MTRIPKARAVWARASPMEPYPKISMVFPARTRRSPKPGRSHSHRAWAEKAWNSFRFQAKSRANTCSVICRPCIPDVVVNLKGRAFASGYCWSQSAPADQSCTQARRGIRGSREKGTSPMPISIRSNRGSISALSAVIVTFRPAPVSRSRAASSRLKRSGGSATRISPFAS